MYIHECPTLPVCHGYWWMHESQMSAFLLDTHTHTLTCTQTEEKFILKLCGGQMSMFMLRRRANVQQATVIRQCIQVKVHGVLLFSLHFWIFIWMNSGLMLISECIFAHGKSASLAFHYFVFMSFLLDFRVCCTQVFLFDVKSNHLNKREITDMFSSFAKTVIQKTVENFFF